MRNQPTFPMLLRRLRADRDISQTQLAHQCGVSQAAVSEWENGKSEPTLSSLKRLSESLSVSLDFLCGLSDQETVVSLPPSHWLVDLDLYERMLAGDRSISGGDLWAVAIPSRYRIVHSSEYAAMRSAVPGSRPSRRRS